MVRSPLAPKMTMTKGGKIRSALAEGPVEVFLPKGARAGAVAGLMAESNDRFRLFRGHYEP